MDVGLSLHHIRLKCAKNENIQMNNVNYAAIDCGTNSTRLLIGNKRETLDRQMRITRLGQGVGKTAELSEEAMSRVLNVLEDLRKLHSDSLLY